MGRAVWFALLVSLQASAAPAEADELIPPELVGDSPARYPNDIRSERVLVVLELLIDQLGEVEEATVVSEENPLFDRSALHASTRLRFAPALLGGVPVSVK